MTKRLLVACECSGIVRDEFLKLGWDAYSCDLKPSEKNGFLDKRHIVGDVLKVIDQSWDAMVAHPPCTYVASAGQIWNNHYMHSDRKEKMAEGIEFARKLWSANIKFIGMENPIGVLSTAADPIGNLIIGPPNQIINPWQFGEEFHKPTCLWLKNLPNLKPTEIVSRGEMITYKDKKGKTRKRSKWNSDAKSNEKETTRTKRSRTFIGIAKAMAAQWTEYINQLENTFIILR